MPHEIRVPRLGWSMEEGTFVGWLMPMGAVVNPGDPLFELESEKALTPVESIDAGVLHIPTDSPAPGDAVRVGALLGYLLEAGEAPPEVVQGRDAGSGSVMTEVDETTALAAGDHAEPRLPLRGDSRRVASPRARRVAAELGLDWSTLQGTGRGGRVREVDVRRAATGAIPRSPRRKAIAEHLRAGLSRSIPVTLTTLADATELVALRERSRAVENPVPSHGDIIGCLAARVLTRHLHMASRWDDGYQALVTPTPDAIHIGIAVDTPDGLLVPVVRDLARRSPREVAVDSALLIDRARRGRLSSADLRGSVFTITNLGAYRIDAFTPILNAPEVAILGLGMIRREAVVRDDGAIEPRHRITLSLTFDHAANDGARAAEFLRDLAIAIESPAASLCTSP